jgi:hypothetical protein
MSGLTTLPSKQNKDTSKGEKQRKRVGTSLRKKHFSPSSRYRHELLI